MKESFLKVQKKKVLSNNKAWEIHNSIRIPQFLSCRSDAGPWNDFGNSEHPRRVWGVQKLGVKSSLQLYGHFYPNLELIQP